MKELYMFLKAYNIFSVRMKEGKRKKLLAYEWGNNLGKIVYGKRKESGKFVEPYANLAFYAPLCGCAWKNQRGHLKMSSNVLYGLLKPETRSKY